MIHLFHRLVIIAAKAIKLCWLLLLIRCFGPDNAMALLGCAASVRDRAASVILTVASHAHHLAALIWFYFTREK